jgi:hypothetical protein
MRLRSLAPLFACALLPLAFGSLRAADPRADQLAAIASVASDAYFDQKSVVLAPAAGARVLVRGGFPPAFEPNRARLTQKALPNVTDRELAPLATLAAQIQWQYEFDCWVVDRAVTAKRVDANFLKEQAAVWKKDVNQGVADGFLATAFGKSDPASAFETALYKGFVKQLAATYEVGLAHTLRAQFGNERQVRFQKLWDEKLLPEVTRTERAKLRAQVIELGRTQVLEQANGQHFLIWSGLVARNTSKDALTNVYLDLALTGPANQKVRRTYFFPQLKAGQVTMLVIDDRVWNGQTGPLSADKLLAEVRAWCDQGEQPKQALALPRPPGNTALEFTAGKPVGADELNAAAGGEAAFRALAKNQQSVAVSGTSRGAKVDIKLEFSEPTEPLKSLGGVPIVDTKKFVLVSATLVSGKKTSTVTLDGYFDGATLVLYSHGNLNVVDAPQVAKQYDKLHGTITLSGGKYTVQFPNDMPGAKFVSKE